MQKKKKLEEFSNVSDYSFKKLFWHEINSKMCKYHHLGYLNFNCINAINFLCVIRCYEKNDHSFLILYILSPLMNRILE